MTPSAQAILITDDAALAGAVERAVDGAARALAARARSPARRGAISARSFWCATSTKRCRWSTRIAPEHLEIAAADAERLVARIRNAGAIFIGAHTPEAIGDYVAGSNHVLPTARSARFSSGLGVLDFMKRTSILKCGPEQLRALADAAITLGNAEGLDAHARSVAIRLNR